MSLFHSLMASVEGTPLHLGPYLPVDGLGQDLWFGKCLRHDGGPERIETVLELIQRPLGQFEGPCTIAALKGDLRHEHLALGHSKVIPAVDIDQNGVRAFQVSHRL